MAINSLKIRVFVVLTKFPAYKISEKIMRYYLTHNAQHSFFSAWQV